MDQHKLSREQWEERIQVWHAEHSGMLKWVFHVGPWAGHLTACLITLSLHFYNVVLLVCGFDSELPMWAYSWCVFFSSVLNHMVKHSRIFCTGAENSVASWRSWTCAHYIVIALSGKRSKGLSNLTVIEAFALTDGKAQTLCLSYSLYPWDIAERWMLLIFCLEILVVGIWEYSLCVLVDII